jgi:hypothetical protein
VLVLPHSIGSAGAWRFLYQLFVHNTNPVAIVQHKLPDSSLVQGAILSKVPIVCEPDADILTVIHTGDLVEVDGSTGLVRVTARRSRMLSGGRTLYGLPVGILMLDTRFPRPPGDIGNASTWPFPVRYRIVKGAEPRHILGEGGLAMLAPFSEAAKELEAEGVTMITTSCGFLAVVQRELQAAVSVPVLTSSLLQVPLATRLMREDQRVAIMTSRDSLTERHFLGCGWSSKDLPVHVTVPAAGCAVHHPVFNDRSRGGAARGRSGCSRARPGGRGDAHDPRASRDRRVRARVHQLRPLLGSHPPRHRASRVRRVHARDAGIPRDQRERVPARAAVSVATRITTERVLDFSTAVLRACGLTGEDAQIVADALAWADLRAITPQGIAKLPLLVRRLRSGGARPDAVVRVVSERGAFARLDAGRATGHVAGVRAMRHAMAKAREFGMGIAVIGETDSGSAMGYYASLAARDGLIGIAINNTYPLMPPPGGTTRVVGNQAFGIAVPRAGAAPLLFDSACRC